VIVDGDGDGDVVGDGIVIEKSLTFSLPRDPKVSCATDERFTSTTA
jgi:hypothetical protein